MGVGEYKGPEAVPLSGRPCLWALGCSASAPSRRERPEGARTLLNHQHQDENSIQQTVSLPFLVPQIWTLGTPGYPIIFIFGFSGIWASKSAQSAQERNIHPESTSRSLWIHWDQNLLV